MTWRPTPRIRGIRTCCSANYAVPLFRETSSSRRHLSASGTHEDIGGHEVPNPHPHTNGCGRLTTPRSGFCGPTVRECEAGREFLSEGQRNRACGPLQSHHEGRPPFRICDYLFSPRHPDARFDGYSKTPRQARCAESSGNPASGGPGKRPGRIDGWLGTARSRH